MLNARFSPKSFSNNHDFLLPSQELIEISSEAMEKPYEAAKREYTTTDIQIIADKISEKLVKLVEQQLVESQK